MKLDLHRQDVQWLRRQLRINIRCLICIVLLSLIIRFQPTVPILSTRASTPTASMLIQADIPGNALDELTPLPEESEIKLINKRHTNPVAPSGWRRTSRGWEHVSTWPVTSQKSINELVASQEKREPDWIQFVFAKLRGIPPLMVALLQVTGVAVIIGIAQERRKSV